jgi:hypothetical protein
MALEFIKPTYSPVKSVNGMTGDVVIEIPSHEGLATETYVNEAINNIDIPEVDLNGYATEEYVDRKISEAAIGGDIGHDLEHQIEKVISEQGFVNEDRVREIHNEEGGGSGGGVTEDRVNEIIIERCLVDETRVVELINQNSLPAAEEVEF